MKREFGGWEGKRGLGGGEEEGSRRRQRGFEKGKEQGN